MAARATITAVEEYDFDSWTPEDEDKAIAALAPDIRYIIMEKTFVGRFEDGAIVKLPLTISLQDIEEMSESTPNPVDQVKKLLTTVGGEDGAREFAKHNFTETLAMTEKFFKVFERVSSATLPES